MTDLASSEDELELWNESCSDSEYESDLDHNANKVPDLPNFASTSIETHRGEILSKWFMRFILILQGKFYLPDKCIDFLLNFFTPS